MPDSRPGGDSLDSAAMRTAYIESTFRLIERAHAGDQEALERLLVRHLTPLRHCNGPNRIAHARTTSPPSLSLN